MTSSRVMMGTLVPLESIHATSCSLPNIPLFEGDNVIGRHDLKITDKRVSRKHISLKASANDGIEVFVEGPNPIIVSSQGQRRKICSNDKVFIKDGDIVELIPSTHLFKYMAIGNDNSFQTTQKSTNSSKREKRHSEERESSVAKRNKQILEDEALARDLQQAENDSILEGSFEKKEALHNFRVSEETISDTFMLMRVQGLPSWSNSNSVTIQDVIQVLKKLSLDFKLDGNGPSISQTLPTPTLLSLLRSQPALGDPPAPLLSRRCHLQQTPAQPLRVLPHLCSPIGGTSSHSHSFCLCQDPTEYFDSQQGKPIATGGTLCASINLLEHASAEVVECACVIELPELKVMVGALVSLESIHATSCSVPNIPLFDGDNVIGRNDLKITDKRVSRKHISLKAFANESIEVFVEGPNPIIVSSQGQRRKICSNDKVFIKDGDIVELIPSTHLFKYMAIGNDNSFQTPQKNTSSSKREKRHNEERENSVAKRNKQILEDEALARDLQQAEDDSLLEGSSEKKEALHNFRVSEERISNTFRLMQVQGLPSWANSNSVTIQDVIQGDVLVAILSNYMVDIDWLLSACPTLKNIPHVLVAHGESGASFDHLPKNKLANWVFHKPPLPISYGTHHSKAMFLVYPTGIRIIVHTANLIHVDWNNKTQGLWMQDFPWKDASTLTGNRSPFENDLVDYLAALKLPELRVSLPSIGNVSINAAFFRKFDYSKAKVRLIASVPGYHNGSSLTKWGHMKLRSILESCKFSKEFCKSPLIYQFSSLGSLDEKWMNEFGSSLSAGKTDDGLPLGNGKPLIIFPTVEDVRCSLEGYAAGGAIPSPQKNVEKDFLKKYWARWKAGHVARCRAMPHIKTYTRYNGQNIAWFLLTSANLSKAAWGALQKNNTQLMIRSYELGVLFLPSMLLDESSFSCTRNTSVVPTVSQLSSHVEKPKAKLVSLCWNKERESNSSSEIVRLPIPYQLPPLTYTSEDIPWSWDKRYTKKDVYGQTWPRHV